ncbi:hypothetical protein [Methylocystis echinoides]|uniref:DUF4148 domain-containing protein n=1 Tax=Methylocystis echinoides TaxID=29468 RepID=A0A9W6GQI0_9HYPH|nr:hypothetical protein [Methylocystis echinoides]GLI91202.1 hypothetical protein LMG27198_01940 [Methylocystis echinoides]
MSLKSAFLGAAVGVVMFSGSAFAYERHYDFGQIWVDAVKQHQRDEALSATPRDVSRHQPAQAIYGSPHDPSGTIILEGAR